MAKKREKGKSGGTSAASDKDNPSGKAATSAKGPALGTAQLTPTVKLDRTSMGKAARKAARAAIAVESQSIIDEIEADARAAAAKANAKHTDPKKAKHKRKHRSEQEVAKAPGRGAKEHDHGRVEDDDGQAAFGRLVTEIAGLVQLVEQHRPEVRRAVFDSYVTAVIEFGATAKDLGFVDVRDGVLGKGDEDVVVDTVVTAPKTGSFAPGGVLEFGKDDDLEPGDGPLRPRRRSFESARPAASRTGPVREAEGLEREVSEPRRARTSANRGRSGLLPLDPVDVSDIAVRGGGATGLELPGDVVGGDVVGGDVLGVDAPDVDAREDATPRIRRRRSAAQSRPSLESLAEAQPPRNNDQRNTLIVQAHENEGTPATVEAIEAGYERMGWRVPVNVRTSMRQTVRKGLVLLGDDDTYRPV